MHADHFERSLPRLLDELADEQTPDYYTDLFWQTARTSQRPAWTIRERWLPMLEIARQPVVAQPPWRAIGLLVLLVGVLAAGLVLAGARQKLPPLTGPAANGLVAFARDGDILTFDPRTSVTSVVVSGADIDGDPIWSQDGTRLLFRRDVPGKPDAAEVMIARANGTGIRQLTPDPLTDIRQYSLSSDGRTAAIIADVKGIPALFAAAADGGGIQLLDIHAIPLDASFDPSGTRILVVGAHGVDGSYGGLYTIGVDGTDLQTILEPQMYAPMEGVARWSPDGSRIAYGRWEPNQSRVLARVHVRTADGTSDVVVGHQEGAWYEALHGWAPDGTRLLIERSTQPADGPQPFNPVVVSVDGSTPDVDVAFDSEYLWLDQWSPDGTAILAAPLDEDGKGLQQLLWDAATGQSHPTPWTATSFPSWQRVAP